MTAAAISLPCRPKSRRIRVAIAGGGLMGRWHAYYAKHCGADIIGIVDPDREKAATLAAKSDAAAFASLEDLLSRFSVDAVHLCSPQRTHFELANAVVKARIHLLVEKPLTEYAYQAEQLHQMASESAVVLCPVHQFAFQDGVLEAAAWLPRIGPLVHFDSVFCSAGGEHSSSTLDEIAASILPHPISIAQRLLPGGFPEHDITVRRPRAGEWRIASQADGVSISIHISMSGRPTESSCRLIGQRGTIHMDLFHGFAFFEPGAVSRVSKIVRPFDTSVRRLRAATANLAQRAAFRELAYPGLKKLIRLFYLSVQDHNACPISPVDSLQVARLGDSIRSSSAFGTEKC